MTCMACGRAFGGLRGFDDHRQGGFIQIRDRKAHLANPVSGKGGFCVDPAALGMNQNGKGVWVRKPPAGVAA